MHVFVSRALHKILREAPKKHTQLRTACTEVIGEFALCATASLAQLQRRRVRPAEELKNNGADMFPPPEAEPPVLASPALASSAADSSK